MDSVATNEMAPLDQVLWAWADGASKPDLGSALHAAVAANDGRSVQVTFETVFTSVGTPFDHIEPRAMIAAKRSSLNGVELLQLADSDGRWVLAAFPTRHPGVFHLVSGLPMTHHRWKKVERWVNKARPVARCYLDHRDFASIGDRLSEFGDVEVVKVTARVVSDGSSINRGFPARDGFLRPTHHDEIAEIEQLGAAVRTLTLTVPDVMNVHVRRLAGATFYSGNFDLFEEQVLTRLEDATAARRRLLTGRARESLKDDLRPVSIVLPEPMLRTRDETGQVLDAIRRMTDLTLAVFHRNPYLHFAVTDEHDGSNFDVMVTHPNLIDIYPGFKASSTALARISQRLGERFGAWEIKDTPTEEPVSVYDLTGS